ncbi:hypothetical protein EBZ37_11580, partial [bacterium]|nr:hypothetical protein [bacterium]
MMKISRFFVLAFFVALGSLAKDLRAADSPAPVASSSPPVFMMERYYSSPSSQKEDPPTRVGDIIRFRWIGSPTPPGSAVEVVVLEEGSSL